MTTWMHGLDVLLRSHRAPNATATPSMAFLLRATLILGGIYGFFMGWYALRSGGVDAVPQLIASTLKLPTLYLVTCAITMPSLYVFSAIAGARLSPGDVGRMMLTMIVVTLAIAASLAPILGFFTLSTDSYAFMVLLNIAFLGLAGTIGTLFLVKAVFRAHRDAMAASGAPVTLAATTLAAPGFFLQHGILIIWLIVYGLVGSQTGWLLRPFVGAPGKPFRLYRDGGGSFLEAAARSLVRLLDGGA